MYYEFQHSQSINETFQCLEVIQLFFLLHFRNLTIAFLPSFLSLLPLFYPCLIALQDLKTKLDNAALSAHGSKHAPGKEAGERVMHPFPSILPLT